jgi:hypothetical protein
VFRVGRRISALGVIVVVLMGLTACGGSDAVVRVGGNVISKAMVDHWTRIEAILAYEVIPKRPIPKGVVPDPPNYTACVSFLKTFEGGATVQGQKKLTVAQLKGVCREQEEEFRRKMVSFLISYYWNRGELAEHGVDVTDAEVKHQREKFVSHEFPNQVEYHNYLAYTGMSVSDLSLIMRSWVLNRYVRRILISALCSRRSGFPRQIVSQVSWWNIVDSTKVTRHNVEDESLLDHVARSALARFGNDMCSRSVAVLGTAVHGRMSLQ